MKRPVFQILCCVIIAIGLSVAFLYALAYRGVKSEVATVKVSKGEMNLPRGVRVRVRHSDGSPAVGIPFTYEDHSGYPPHVLSDSSGFTFIERNEDDRVRALYIGDSESDGNTAIWRSPYDSNILSAV